MEKTKRMAGTELQNEVFFFYTKDMNIYNDNSKTKVKNKHIPVSSALSNDLCSQRIQCKEEKKMQTHPVVNMKSTDAMLQQNTVMFL